MSWRTNVENVLKSPYFFSGLSAFCFTGVEPPLPSKMLINKVSKPSHSNSFVEPYCKSDNRLTIRNSCLNSEGYTYEDSFFCPCCGFCGKRYQANPAGNRLHGRCPICGAFERHRTLCDYLSLNNNSAWGAWGVPKKGVEGLRILYWGPERCVSDCLVGVYGDNMNEFQFFDINPEKRNVPPPFEVEMNDLTNVLEDDEKFDLQINFHIIEHTHSAEKAVAELSRITKPGGAIVIEYPCVISQKESVLDCFSEKGENSPACRNKENHHQISIKCGYVEELFSKAENGEFECFKLHKLFESLHWADVHGDIVYERGASVCKKKL